MNYCKFSGCDRPSRSGGYCNAHYARKRRCGNPAGLQLMRDEKPKIVSRLTVHFSDTSDAQPGLPTIVGVSIHRAQGDRLFNWQRMSDLERQLRQLLAATPSFPQIDLTPAPLKWLAEHYLKTVKAFQCDLAATGIAQ